MFKPNRKQTIIMAFVGLSVLSIIYLVSSSRKHATTPPVQAVVPINPNTKDVKAGKINLASSLVAPAVPADLNTYSDLYRPDILALAPFVAKYFQLQPQETVVNSWTNSGSSRNLNATAQNHSLFYQDDQALSGAGVRPEQGSSQQEVQKLIQAVPLWKNFSLKQDQVIYYKVGGSELRPGTATDFDLIELSYEQRLDGFPVFRDARTVSPLTVLVGADNKIAKIRAHAYFVSPSSSSESHPAISFNEAKEILISNHAQLLDISSGEIIVKPPTQIGDVNIDQVEVEYRSATNGSSIMPYYHFSGNASSSYRVHYLVAAIRN